jgi:hypothetical protein
MSTLCFPRNDLPIQPLPHYVHFIVVFPPWALSPVHFHAFFLTNSSKDHSSFSRPSRQTPHVRQCWNGLRELAGRFEWEKRSGDEVIPHRVGRRFCVCRNCCEWAERMCGHKRTDVLLFSPVSITRAEQLVSTCVYVFIEGLDTCIAFEYVEERDVPRGEARDERAADAILLRGEIASEEGLTPRARQDGGVICELCRRREHPWRLSA